MTQLETMTITKFCGGPIFTNPSLPHLLIDCACQTSFRTALSATKSAVTFKRHSMDDPESLTLPLPPVGGRGGGREEFPQDLGLTTLGPSPKQGEGTLGVCACPPRKARVAGRVAAGQTDQYHPSRAAPHARWP